MAAIGVLIMAENESTVRSIIKAILLICLSETIGNGTPTLNSCEDLIEKLATEESTNSDAISKLIKDVNTTDDGVNDGDNDIINNDEETELEDCGYFNYWKQFGLHIYEETVAVIEKEEGNKDNPRMCPKISAHLLKKVETIPLWGNVCRNSFRLQALTLKANSI